MDEQLAAELNAAIRQLGRSHRFATGWVLDQVGLSLGQEMVLLTLAEHEPRTMSELAGAAACEAPTMTSAVRRLEGAGLVSRAPDPADRRATLVTLTERGRQLLAPLQQGLGSLAESAVSQLSPDEVVPAVDLLQRLAAGLAPPPGTCGPGTCSTDPS